MPYLTNKVALITGGASGIGLSVVEKLLYNGVKGVGIVDISEENGRRVARNLQEAYGDKVIFVKADVTIQKEFEDAFEKITDKFKNLDIVINNAGIVNEIQWEKTISVNLAGVVRGTYLAVDKYLPKFKSNSEGVVVNIASVVGINATELTPVYCCAKSGVIALGTSLGTQAFYTQNKVRIITICPGVISTPLVNSALTVRDPDALKEGMWKISKIRSSPVYVADSLMKIINIGNHGSVWVVEDEEPPYEVSFPYRADLRRKL